VQRILAEVARPWVANGLEIQVTCSVGISMFPADGSDALAMLKHADTAMFEAKRLGRNNSQFFTEHLDGAALNRLQMSSSLRRAIDNRELVLHYQPKCELATGGLVGAEALLRWQRPGEPLVLPNEFIALAEEAGLIEAVGEWVLRAACRQNFEWQAAGYAPIPVSVNVSPLQLE
jgi:predicted signal transduction protein with EAL and GGDEF domain